MTEDQTKALNRMWKQWNELGDLTAKQEQAVLHRIWSATSGLLEVLGNPDYKEQP